MTARKRRISVLLTTALAAVIWFGGIFPVLRAAVRTSVIIEKEVVAIPFPGELIPLELPEELAAIIDPDRNIITDETGNLAPFLQKLAAIKTGNYDGVVNILHIGDSHVQAGFWDARLREHFSRDFGYGGAA